MNRRRIHLREISGGQEQDTPPETVGQDLRAARLRRGDEIAQVSRALKIRKDHLEALEEDRLEDLPGKTYAIGFVRSYARHLGLDAAEYVERFKQEIAGRTDAAVQPVAPIHQDERHLPQGWRIIAFFVVLLFAGGAWHLLSSGGDTSQPVPPPPALNPPRPAAPPKPKPVTVPPQEAMPSPAADTAAPFAGESGSQQTAALPPPAAGPQSPATRTQPGPAAPPIAAQSVSSTPSQGAGPAVPAVATGTVYGEQNRGARVILRARGDSRITVRAEDGTLYINRDLKAGDSYQVPNLPGLLLAASDAGAIEVDLDGSILGRAGEEQQILGRVSLDPQSLVDRFHR
ncbi:MAG TPA: helix-turn-helix domain-containing protein [Rhizomicrobium sp.]|nr:helix-turn-helix domain-containing protein [Rhizomicrobium sp.]